MSRRKNEGFTLIELLVVIAIIGIICAIAIPNLIVAMQRARQRRTMVDMRSLSTAWEARNVEMSRYNAAGASYEGADQKVDINTVISYLKPTYIKNVPSSDGWHNPFICYTDQPWGADQPPAQKYVIISGGEDGVVDDSAKEGPITNFDCDIVFSNGRFLSYPDGLTFK